MHNDNLFPIYFSQTDSVCSMTHQYFFFLQVNKKINIKTKKSTQVQYYIFAKDIPVNNDN